ncbi:hypothetical protein HGRIS_009711 [Hohenbuehelia grisea]|uniref:Endoglucanase n=1 Tax=Hohenbuehelia grisea TaxID=104357 RepID=A0ABR3J2F8_9AGAR
MFIAHLLLVGWIVPSLAQVSVPESQFKPPDPLAGAVSSNSSDSPNPQWSTLLGNLLYFYEAQRSGPVSSARIRRVDWRNDSALDDGKDAGVDLSGGYYDAGDYIKTTFPLSFTLMSICWGALDFGRGYDLSNQTAYLDDMLRWGLDWLMKAHPSNDTLFVQVADSRRDNDYWGGDSGIPLPRPVYQINSTSPGTDAAAMTSAAFSACSALYANRTFSSTSFTPPASLTNSSYAELLLSHAQALHHFALDSSQQVYQIAVPAVSDAYASSSYKDDLVLASLWLSWALGGDSELYANASSMFSKFSLSEGLGGNDGDKVFNWDEKTPGLPVLFAQVAPSVNKDSVSSWQSQAERYFDRIVGGKSRAYLTGGGLLFFDGDSDSASLNPALNTAMLLSRYAQIASSSEKKKSYLDFAQNQVDYVMGKNPMSAPYVVGVNPNSPQNPHSAPSSGGSDLNKIDTLPPLGESAHTLFGAVVGGPTKGGQFHDIRSDWPQTEVALDYNAPLLTLAAMHVIGSSVVAADASQGAPDPYYTRLQPGEYEKAKPTGTPCDAVFPCKKRVSRVVIIVLAVVLTVVGLAIALLCWYYVRTVRARSKTG